jgi:hypothetical protein
LADYLVHVSYGEVDGGVRTYDVSSASPMRVSGVSEFDARWVGATASGGLATVAGSPVRVTTMADDGTVLGTQFVYGAWIGAPT